MRLGGPLFDPYVAILDTKRFELAVSDDTALALQDPIASVIVARRWPLRHPNSGKLLRRRRRQSVSSARRLLSATFVGFPARRQIGEDLDIQFLADMAGPIPQIVKLPDDPTALIDLLPEQNGLHGPLSKFCSRFPFPNVLEVEPNNDVATATNYEGELPVAFNGIINQPGDIDFFRFKAKKDQVLDIHVIARQLRSPLDSVLVLYNAQGGGMASNDDSGGPDSYLRFTVPADGEYLVSVTDHLHQGGPDYTYRIEITPVKPSLRLSIPEVNVNSQERQNIAIPRGNRMATLIRGTRADFGGELAIQFGRICPRASRSLAENMAANLDVVASGFRSGGRCADCRESSAI